MTYDCASPGEYAWFASNTWNDVAPMDASDYDHVSLRLKREHGNDGFYIKIRYGTPATPFETDPLYIGDYCVNTGEWQLADVPLDDFAGLDKTGVMSIIFIFDNTLLASSGAVYVDNLQFSNGCTKQESAGAVRIDKVTNTLYVDGEPFVIKSVGYQPYPIGTWPGSMPPDAIDPRVYDRDLPLIAAMGCNTIRTWGAPPLTLLNKAEEYGLKVLAGFWIDPNSDYADPVVRGNIKSDFSDFINVRKSSSAVLMWGIGNENNYNAGFSAGSYYSLANELAQIAYQEEGATYHPVLIINGGLYWIGVDEAGAGDLQLSYIDAWGSNLYAREYAQYGWLGGTRDIFDVYKEKTSKPLVVTEYGVDAFHTTQIDWDDVLGRFIASAGYQDEAVQADWAEANVLEIMASNVCLGSSLMEYSDEWWKDGEGSLFDQDLGGAAWWDGNQPDNFSNEEYYGVVEIAPDGTWSAPDSLDDVRLRQVYYTLQSVFGGSSPAPEFEYLIVDVYDDADPNTNKLGRWTGGNPSYMADVADPNFDGSKCREFRYQDLDWYASNVWDGGTYSDISDYEYLTFVIKGVLGGETISVELQHGTGSISSVIFSATTTAWQEVAIPLSSFVGLNKTAVRAISIVFEGDGTIYLDYLGFGKLTSPSPLNNPPVVSDIPDQMIDEGGSFVFIALDDYVEDPDNADDEMAWTAEGNEDLIVYIDPVSRRATVSPPWVGWSGEGSITFRATDPAGEYDEDTALFTVNAAPPEALIVDDYNDSDRNTNSLGFWTGSNIAVLDTMKQSFDGTQCRRIVWWKSSWYSSNMWDGINYSDISGYDYVSFRVKGKYGGESFNVELHSGAGSVSRCRLYDIVAQWQEVRIPLSDFQGLDKTRLRHVGFTFKGIGTVYVDNLGFSN